WTEAGGTREAPCPSMLTDVRWAPDSRTLVGGGLSANAFCRIDARSAAPSRIDVTMRPGDFVASTTPSWSPDQKKLYFRSVSNLMAGGDGSTAFVEKDLASGSERVIIRRPNLGALDLSPDGSFIVTIVREAVKSSALLLIPIAGGEPKELLRRPDWGNA